VFWPTDVKSGGEKLSRQCDILPRLLDQILEIVPDGAVYLSGSVSFGYERPESDVDIIVVVPDIAATHFPGGKVKSQTQQAKVVDAVFDDVRLDMVFVALEFVEQELVQKPWRGYYFAQLRILHDPRGIIRSAQSRIARWFDDHPDLVVIWEEWMAQRKTRAVSGGKQQGELIRKFPDIFALWEHLDPMFEE